MSRLRGHKKYEQTERIVELLRYRAPRSSTPVSVYQVYSVLDPFVVAIVTLVDDVVFVRSVWVGSNLAGRVGSDNGDRFRSAMTSKTSRPDPTRPVRFRKIPDPTHGVES